MSQPLNLTGLGLRIGHAAHAQCLTGCTALIFDRPGAVVGVDVRGGAPGTRETDALRPENSVTTVDALLLTGGSAFGLAAADGVMRYLHAQQRGVQVGEVRVPIVSAAAIFDLAVSHGCWPDAEVGYRAAAEAQPMLEALGSVGAGLGATVGKLLGEAHCMRGGLGAAMHRSADGLIVLAVVVVNAVGDIRDEDQTILAGAYDGGFLNTEQALIEGRGLRRPLGNTTVAAIVTNAKLSKSEATKVAQMAHDGLARSIVPVHTPWDGDTVFAASTGRLEPNLGVAQVGVTAAALLATAVRRGVVHAAAHPVLRSVRSIKP